MGIEPLTTREHFPLHKHYIYLDTCTSIHKEYFLENTQAIYYIYIYIYIYPNCAYYRDDELWWRFHTFDVFGRGGSPTKYWSTINFSDTSMFFAAQLWTNYDDAFIPDKNFEPSIGSGFTLLHCQKNLSAVVCSWLGIDI